MGLGRFEMTSIRGAGKCLLTALSFVLLPLSANAASGALSFTAHSSNLNPGDSPLLLALDGQGYAYAVATVSDSSGRAWIRVTKTNPQGSVVASYQFGGTGMDTPSAIKVDAQGEVVIAGSTTSTDFPTTTTVGPAIKKSAAFVVKLDAGLAGITASTLLGGSQYAASYLSGTGAGAVDVDSAGNVYVGGYTAALDFPVTAGAYQTAPPGHDNLGGATLGFVAELSPGLSKILSATYYGSSTVECLGGNCAGVWGSTSVAGLAVAPSGAIAVSANTLVSAQQFSQGVLAASFAPGLGTVAWKTLFGRDGTKGGDQFADAMTVDGNGDMVIVGSASNGVYESAGAVQSCGDAPPSGGFVAKFSGSSGAMQFLTAFGCLANSEAQSIRPAVHSVAVDASGTIWITGVADPITLPVAPSSPASGPTYLAALAADGTAVEALYEESAGLFGQALGLTQTGSPVILGSAGFLMLANSAGGPSLTGVANSAGSAASTVIAPAELVSLYGTGLGPATALGAQVVGGVVANTLGGYQLEIGGVAAPLLYMSANQINAIVPYEVAGRDSVFVALMTPTGTFPLADLSIRPSEPEIFHDPASGYAVAINRDGTLNAATNPAHAGQLVSIWASGAGTMGTAPYVDGAIVALSGHPFLLPSLPVSMLASNDSLEVDFAGNAPGEVYGLLQVNFRIPQTPAVSAGSLAVSLQVGAASGAAVSIYVAQ
jgi:uncharacterized protein (TIGR03437 family)